jgi:YtkA-like
MRFAPASGTKRQSPRKPAPRVCGIRRSGTVIAAVVAASCGAAFAFAGAGCAKSSDAPLRITIENEIRPQPVRVGAATITLKLADTRPRPIAGAKVSLEAAMSHPGMAPVFGDTQEVASGKYEGTIQFTMAGDWVILLHITLPDGKKIEREIRVGNVRAS